MLLYAHLGSVFLFLLAHGTSAAMALQLKREPSVEGIRALIVLSDLSSRLMYPFLLLIVLTGIALGFAGQWWGRAWIWTAIAVLVVTYGLMILMGRQYRPLRVAAGQRRGSDRRPEAGPSSTPDDVRRMALSTNPWPITVLGVVALAALLWLMIFKPF